jgi:hypothetical protein
MRTESGEHQFYGPNLMQEPIVRSGFLSQPSRFSRFAVGLLGEECE